MKTILDFTQNSSVITLAPEASKKIKGGESGSGSGGNSGGGGNSGSGGGCPPPFPPKS